VPAFAALIHRDLVLAWRIGGGGGMAVAFFLLIVTLVPLGLGPDLPLLARVAPGMVWIGALLATLLALDRLFQADWEDGNLDLLALGPLPLEAVVLGKSLAHWLTTGLPLVVAAPVLGLMLGLPGHALWALVAALALGTPSLSLIGAVGAALTAGVRRGGLLLSLLVLPLYIPVLVFGVGAVQRAVDGAPAGAPLMVLGALALFSLVLAPVAAAAALRIQLS
jgi:heme exporter protein B